MTGVVLRARSWGRLEGYEVHGTADAEAARCLGDSLAALVTDWDGTVVVDLTGLRLTGRRAARALARSLADGGVERLVLCCARPWTRRLLRARWCGGGLAVHHSPAAVRTRVASRSEAAARTQRAAAELQRTA